MRAIVVGASGQLGTALLAAVPQGVEAVGLTRAEFDVTRVREEGVAKLRGAEVIINCAAYTNVDAAEIDEAAAVALNAQAPAGLAEIARTLGAHFVHLSTDYVFGQGAPRRPLLVDDPKHPNSVYGRTKLAGERAVLAACPGAAILRTAWLFSGDTQPHRDFVSTMAGFAREGRAVNVVADQWGSPTFVGDLARGVWSVATDRISGVRHAVGVGAATWCDVAKQVYDECGADPALVTPCSTEEFPRPAPRPEWSVLDRTSWTDSNLPAFSEWRTAVRQSLSTKV